MKILLVFLSFFATFSGLQAQLLNGSFENWDSTFTHSYQSIVADTYNIPDAIGGDIELWDSMYESDFWGICKTTDATDGNFAAILHNWYHYATQTIIYNQPITTRPIRLTGQYKYTEAFFDVTKNEMPFGTVNIYLTSITGDTIATGNFVFNPVEIYSPFEVEINYTSSATPNQIIIQFLNSDHFCSNNIVCNFLYLDNLDLEATTSNYETFHSEVSISPNPTTGSLYIEHPKKIESIEVFNLLGKSMLNISDKNNIDVSFLKNGIYLVSIKIKGNPNATIKKIIKQ